jgi:hypothetical protein
MITFNSLGKYGRFGNQMFQYATLFAIAKTKKCEFGIPYGNKSDNDYENMCLQEVFGNLTAKDSTNYTPQHKATYNNSVYNAGIFGVPDDTDICGYFQSEKYFVKYREWLLKEFQFKKEIYDKAADIRQLSKNKCISVHIRLGDYLNQQHNYPICTIDYYKEALALMPEDCLIIVFSDDVEKATEVFNTIQRPFVVPETNNKYIDMCAMSLCEYHIIANSSFSWWGAWLANSKKTVAPAQWYGSNADYGMPTNWSDIYCDGWSVI